MSDKLAEIYKHCSRITIEPHNVNDKCCSVTVRANVSIKHKSGCYQYAEIYTDRPTLEAAIDSMAYLVEHYKQGVEQMP